MGRQPTAVVRPHRPQGDARRRRVELFARLGVKIDPDRPTARPLDRRPADHRDREGHLARRARARHGRADRGAQRRRGRPALRRRPQPARRGSRAALHLAPLRRGLRPVRHGHRDARRRRTSPPARSPTPPSTKIVQQMVGREVVEPLPEAGGRRSAMPCSVVEGLTQAGEFHDVVVHVRAGEIVGAGRTRRRRPQRDRPRDLRRRPLLVGNGHDQRHAASRAATRPPRWTWASRSSPRTAASRASCSSRRSRATRPSRSASKLATLGLHHVGARERRRAHLGQPARGQDGGARRRVGHPQRRQPAEGRAGQVAGDRAEPADHRRAHARHRRRHQGRGAPPAQRARRRRASPS